MLSEVDHRREVLLGPGSAEVPLGVLVRLFCEVTLEDRFAQTTTVFPSITASAFAIAVIPTATAWR
jgi:hypothetical protein